MQTRPSSVLLLSHSCILYNSIVVSRLILMSLLRLSRIVSLKLCSSWVVPDLLDLVLNSWLSSLDLPTHSNNVAQRLAMQLGIRQWCNAKPLHSSDCQMLSGVMHLALKVMTASKVVIL